MSLQLTTGFENVLVGVCLQEIISGNSNQKISALDTLKQYVESKMNSKTVKVLQDDEKEFIEIDFNNMDIGKMYLVKYDDEWQAVQRISKDEMAFYDVEL